MTRVLQMSVDGDNKELKELNRRLFEMGRDSWSLVYNHLRKELGQWFDEYIDLFGGIDKYE